MDTKKVAEELVAGCRENRTTANLDKLYAKDAVSVEATDMGQGREAKGLDAIKGKHEWWENSMEVLDATVEGPLMHGDDRFGVIFSMKAKEKATGNVQDMKEMAVYHVKNGKIVREEFFY